MTSYGVLKPFQNLEKTNDPIPRKHSDRWADGRTDRPYFAGSIRSPSWVQKLLAWSKKTKITLINFMPLVFYTPWKHQKTRGFSGGIERDQRHEMGEPESKKHCVSKFEYEVFLFCIFPYSEQKLSCWAEIYTLSSRADRTLSNIYDQAFLRRQSVTFRRLLFSQKNLLHRNLTGS